MWRKATNKTNHVTKKTKIIRCALIAATGAFKTTPTLALEFLMQVLPIEIKAKWFALNTWYRLVRSGMKIYPALREKGYYYWSRAPVILTVGARVVPSPHFHPIHPIL